MSTKPATTEQEKRSWRDYSRAFGRAHRKASTELETSMPLLRHLEELRQRLFKAFGAVILTTLVSFAISPYLIDYFATPIGGREALVSIEVTENIAIFMRVSLLCGIVLGMPFIVYQAMRFVLPGLKFQERMVLLLVVPSASLLFLAGVAFTWFVMLPVAIPFLVNFLGITTQVRPSNYFHFITTIMFWIGLCFEMPLVTTFLAKLKIITARQLASGWRYAIVFIAIIAAVITPTVDPVTMGVVMAPLLCLYGISVLLAVVVGRK
jgi:sec-independent protein translocase protein TatC